MNGTYSKALTLKHRFNVHVQDRLDHLLAEQNWPKSLFQLLSGLSLNTSANREQLLKADDK